MRAKCSGMLCAAVLLLPGRMLAHRRRYGDEPSPARSKDTCPAVKPRLLRKHGSPLTVRQVIRRLCDEEPYRKVVGQRLKRRITTDRYIAAAAFALCTLLTACGSKELSRSKAAKLIKEKYYTQQMIEDGARTTQVSEMRDQVVGQRIRHTRRRIARFARI